MYDVYGQRIDSAPGQDAGLPQCLRQVVGLTFLSHLAALDLHSSTRTSSCTWDLHALVHLRQPHA